MSGGRLEVAVLGPGGVGGLVGALLARRGDSVVVLAGRETASAIEERGLDVKSARFGDFTARVATAQRLAEPVDVCFVAVKATHLEAALERVPAETVGDGVVIPLLNGLEHMDLLRRVYPRDSVVAGAIRIETARVAAGVIHHTSPFALIDIAPSATNRERIDRVAAHLKGAGFDVRLREDEAAMLWDKFALLAPMALLTTHERANVGVVRSRHRDDAVAMVRELAAVADAEGVKVDAEGIVRVFDSVPDSMESSMQRDQASGRPLELDALGGALLRLAAKHGIEVPVTRRLVSELASRSGQRIR